MPPTTALWTNKFGTDAHSEIFLFDGTTTIPLTNNSFDDLNPQISCSNVVWRRLDGMDRAVFQATIVPGPSTLALAATGLIGLLTYGWRRRERA